MRTKLFHLAGLLSIAFLVFALIVATGTAVSAKGARNTGGDSGERTYGNSSRNDSGSASSRSNNQSEQRVEQRVEQRTESRQVSAPDPPATPKYEPRYEPKYQSNRSDSNTSGSNNNSETQRDTNSSTTYRAGNNSNGSPQPQVETRSEIRRESGAQSGSNENPPQIRSGENAATGPHISNRVTGRTETSDSISKRSDSPPQTLRKEESNQQAHISNRVGERTDAKVTDLPPVKFSGTHNERNDNPQLPDIRSGSKSPTVVGAFRKEFANLGQIWKERSERRNTASDRQERWQN